MPAAAATAGAGGAPLRDDRFDRSSLLRTLAADVIWPAYRSFEASAAQLEAATSAYCGALAAGDAAATPDEARRAWRSTIADWQYLEAFQIGAIADASATLRNEVYSWPLVNPCGVDREVVKKAAEGAAYVLTTQQNRKGLDAIEYLLFDPVPDHACTDAVADTATWNAAAELERLQKRCAYLALLTADVTAKANILTQAWDPAQGDGVGRLTRAEGYADPHAAVNALSDSLFYLDTFVKDKKLAAPAGFGADCIDAPCPELAEHPFAAFSREAALENLRGFRAAFLGQSDEAAAPNLPAFDDFLVAVDGAAVAERMTAHLNEAIFAFEGLEGSLATLAEKVDPTACDRASIEPSNSTLCALHARVKRLTDDLRAEFVEILELKAPQRVSGDND